MLEIPLISNDITVIPRASIFPKPSPKNVITNQKMLDESDISKCEREVSSMKPFRNVKNDIASPNNANLVNKSFKFNPWRARTFSISEGIICRIIRGDTVKTINVINTCNIVFILNLSFHRLLLSSFYL